MLHKKIYYYSMSFVKMAGYLVNIDYAADDRMRLMRLPNGAIYLVNRTSQIHFRLQINMEEEIN